MESSEQRNDEILGNEEELTTIQQVEVPFLDARILALLGSDEDIYIPIITFSENVLGLYSGTRQVTRIKKDDALASALKKTPIETPGGLQATQCLHLDMFTVWLLSIQEKSCKESIRPTLTQYKSVSEKGQEAVVDLAFLQGL